MSSPQYGIRPQPSCDEKLRSRRGFFHQGLEFFITSKRSAYRDYTGILVESIEHAKVGVTISHRCCLSFRKLRRAVWSFSVSCPLCKLPTHLGKDFWRPFNLLDLSMGITPLPPGFCHTTITWTPFYANLAGFFFNARCFGGTIVIVADGVMCLSSISQVVDS